HPVRLRLALRPTLPRSHPNYRCVWTDLYYVVTRAGDSYRILERPSPGALKAFSKSFSEHTL
ncbi:MAG: hypothetical protein AAFQ82_20655, partial [Myxococcota bacterium]